MNRLFIELYLDEDVNVLIADLLRARGFVATTTLAEGQIGNSDAEQLAFAVRRQVTLLTHNRVDFEVLAQQYAAIGQAHYGIISANRRTMASFQQRGVLHTRSFSASCHCSIR